LCATSSRRRMLTPTFSAGSSPRERAPGRATIRRQNSAPVGDTDHRVLGSPRGVHECLYAASGTGRRRTRRTDGPDLCAIAGRHGGSGSLYLRFRRILIKMADVFFSSSWRILEPYGRAVQSSHRRGVAARNVRRPGIHSVAVRGLGGHALLSCSDTDGCCAAVKAVVLQQI
jgi:hypothetical protein